MNFNQTDPYSPRSCEFDSQSWCRPQDSGYASGPNNPFETAFQSHFPVATQSYAQSQYLGPEQRHAPSYTHSMPLPYTYQHFDSYDSLDARLSKLSVDTGINTLTGYCDIDSMLAAAHDNTCTTQPERFQSFASLHTSLTCDSRPTIFGPLTPPPLIREPAFPELEKSPVSSGEPFESPTKTSRGRRRGRSTHTDIERRYRHNLMAHFRKLASTVPSIPTQQPAKAGQTPKPSKAEVLLAACDYISQLENEVAQLRIAIGCDLSPRRKALMIDSRS
ncbi:hypothetical protein E4T50_02153 [Aureobasidium sp. EXF-12298]|nr:hypothetical protein E4T50_02153 [Aureobasidium sp. EXF-12298]KAI4766569.1 hypothetical protein E4T51_00529 [Aureobasidium sp. EXF-12344]KAI4776621.1 hypothetical protein E4T52_08446 [Aureobasidium sp. EXF-3400]